MSGLRIDISVLGAREVDRALRRFEARVQRKLMRKALRAAMRPVFTEVKQRAPVKSGALRGAIRLRVPPKRKGSGRGVLRIAVIIPGRIELGIAGGGTFYPAKVELGTRRSAPHPFMRSVLHEQEAQVIDRVASELRAGIRQMAGAR